MSIYVAGLDLGQLQDHTGLVVIEAHGTMYDTQYEGVHPLLQVPTTEYKKFELAPITSLDIRHVERFPLQTKYQTITADMNRRMAGIPQPRYLAVDETGVGVGVCEMLSKLNPVGITITNGREAMSPGHQKFHVPKRDLVAVLQVHLQNSTLRIAKELPHAALLMNELRNFRAKISNTGHDTYEAWREADHDDLVLAAGIAGWLAKIAFDIMTREAQEFLRAKQYRPYSISPI